MRILYYILQTVQVLGFWYIACVLELIFPGMKLGFVVGVIIFIVSLAIDKLFKYPVGEGAVLVLCINILGGISASLASL